MKGETGYLPHMVVLMLVWPINGYMEVCICYYFPSKTFLLRDFFFYFC